MIEITEESSQGSVTNWMEKWKNVTGTDKKIPNPPTEPFMPEGFKIVLMTTVLGRDGKMVRGGSMRVKKRNHHKSLRPVLASVKELSNCVPLNPPSTTITDKSIVIDISFSFDNMDPSRKKAISALLMDKTTDLIFQTYRNINKTPVEK